MYIKIILFIDLLFVTGFFCGEEVHFPSDSKDDVIETTTSKTRGKTRGDLCKQFNGSNGVCRETKTCLKQQPKQKMWNVCEWRHGLRVPKSVCCSSDLSLLEEELVEKNRTKSDGKDEGEVEAPNINILRCGISKFTSKNVPTDKHNKRGASDELDLFDLLFPAAYRVVMGKSAKVGQIPWMCAIYFHGQLMCGGTIISEMHVLTAAHCFDVSTNPAEFHIRVASVIPYNGTVYRISRIVPHERYFPPRIYHDIALITLRKRIRFNDYVSPACLPTKGMFGENLINKTSYVAGFGDMSFGGELATFLQEADLRVLNNSYCEENYKNLIESKLKFPAGFKRSLICAGYEEGEKDACQGDSGGPLTTRVNGVSYLIGIVSFGYKCATPHFPGVYTCVRFYINWILQHLGA